MGRAAPSRYNQSRKRNVLRGDGVQREVRRPIRVLIVDDSRDFLDAVSDWIERQPGMEVVGTAANGADALDATESSRPDLVLMDAFMPFVDGFEATRRLKAVAGAPWVVILSVHHGAAIEREAWAAGADAFLPKGELSDHLPALVERLTSGADRDEPLQPRPGRIGRDASTSREAKNPDAPIERRRSNLQALARLFSAGLASISGRVGHVGWRRRTDS